MMKFFLCSSLVLLFLCPYMVAAANPVVIIQNQKSNWHITLLSGTPQVQFAGTELQRYLAEAGGMKLPVARKEQRYNGIIVCLRKDVPEKYRSLLPPPKEGYDGYAIVVSEDPAMIIIAGDNGPGVIYGVYDFLERLGCRWFYPTQDANDPEVVPKLDTVAMASGSWTMASPIRYRICNGDAWFFNMDYTAAAKQLDWAMKNRYNAMGWQAESSKSKKSILEQYHALEKAGLTAELQKRGMFIHGPAHSFDQFLLSDTYFARHPEWFGMRGGKRVPQDFLGAQFCWSNPEARKQFVENVAKFITQAPLIHIFCSIPFDGGVACDCDQCRKAGPSNLLMLLMSEVIEKLKTVRPDVLVETIGGYGPVASPPSNLDVINPRQRLIWAQWGRYHGIGYDDPGYDRANLDGWRRAAKGGFTICQYYTDNFAEPWVMGPFTVAMKSDRRYLLKNHVDGLYMLMWSPGYWWNHSLNGYIAGRCFYDVSLDPFAELKDYAMHYYGPDAGPLIAAYYTEWANHIDLSYHVRGDSKQEDRDMLATERKKWINPAVAVTRNEPLYAYRVGKVEKLHTLAEHLTETHLLHHLVQRSREAGKFDQASNILEKARMQTDSVMSMLYALADLNQGLMDRNEVPGFIKMAVKDWVDKEAKLIAARDKGSQAQQKKLNETEMLPAEVTNGNK